MSLPEPPHSYTVPVTTSIHLTNASKVFGSAHKEAQTVPLERLQSDMFRWCISVFTINTKLQVIINSKLLFLLFIYERERERQSDGEPSSSVSCSKYVQNLERPGLSWSAPGLKLGSGNSIQANTWVAGTQLFDQSLLPLRVCISRKLKSDMWDLGILRSVTVEPKAHPTLLSLP